MGVGIGVNKWRSSTNKPRAINRYKLLEKFLLIGQIAKSTGKRFDNYAVYLFTDNATLKPFEVWPRCIGAGQTIIGKNVNNNIAARPKIAVYKVAE